VLVLLCFVIFWGTFFPLISEALTGTQASVGPPWFGRYIVPLALLLVLLSGLGPMLAWRRATPAGLRRVLLVPVAVGAATLVVLLALGGVSRRPLALIMFCLAAFVLAVVGQELWRGVRARRAMADESVPRALVSLVRRNRRRYGGYTVHVGIAVLFVGIAASTAFQDVRDLRLSPGERGTVGGYEIEYVRPTGKLVLSASGSLEKIDLGAAVRVRRGDGEPVILRPQRSFFPSGDPSLGAVSRYFEGEATSEVGLRSGMRRDLWTVVAPDITDLREVAAKGDAVFRQADELPATERAAALGEGLRRLAARYRSETAPASFRVLVSPLVTWIWIGALIVIGGGLLSLWPAPAGAPRRARAAYSARVARELGRA
jgi:cytochrome c-type biogenesis protein CcmF